MVLTQTKYKEEIIERLTYLSVCIEMNGKQSFFNEHHTAENFVMELLNLIYGYHLVNANNIKLNEKGYDLIDRQNKILVQVTATTAKEKITHTIKGIEEHEEDFSEYTLKMMFLKKADKLKKGKYPIQKIKFDPQCDIIDIMSIASLCDLPLQNLEKIASFIKESIPMGTEVKSVNVSENLYAVVHILASQDKEDEYIQFEHIPVKFKIEDKIKFNRLQGCDVTIKEMSGYYSYINNIYNLQAKEGNQTFVRVFRKIQREYRKILGNHPEYTSDQLFNELCESLTTIVMKDKRLTEAIDYDILEECIEIIVVDAFIKCKIFKSPEEVKL